MTANEIYRRLDEVGQRMGLRQAALRLALAGATALALLWLLAMADLVMHFHRAGRIVGGTLLLVALGAAAWLISAALRRPRPREAIAISIERMFPELDNHLINYLQFSRAGQTNDAMISAYLATDLPAWPDIDGKKWQDRPRWIRAWSLLGGVAAFVVLTALWAGPGWVNAAARILNPFSARPPATFARILAVQPGAGYVMLGAPLTLTARVEGKGGQKVFLDVWPQDDKKGVVQLGKLQGGAQAFAYTLPRVNTSLKYRFRSGDAESEIYAIQALPPLAFKRVDVNITPPPHTGLPPRAFAALATPVIVPQGSLLRIVALANRPLKNATLLNGTNAVVLAEKSGEDRVGALTITDGENLRLVGDDAFGGHAETLINLEVLRDKAPDIRIIAPQGKALLGSGAVPQIEWEITDDFALERVTLERVSTVGHDTKYEAVADFPLKGAKKFSKGWKPEHFSFPTLGNTVAYRLTATDRVAAGLPPHRTLSALITFEAFSAAALASNTAQHVAGEVANTIHKLVELQAANIERTSRLDTDKQYGDPQPWGAIAETQADIRRLAGALLTDPRKPLGPLTLMVRDLHTGAMNEAVGWLTRLLQTPVAGRPDVGQRALVLERRILRTLTMTSDSLGRIEQHREITGLLALIEALVVGQQQTLDGTSVSARKTEVIARELVERQDRLAQDVGEFFKLCRREATTLQQNDREFSGILLKLADTGEQSDKVAATMLDAAEQMEKNAPDKALPLQTTALNHLKEYQRALNAWRTQDAKERAAELQQAVDKAQAELKKLTELQKEIAKSIRQTLQQPDRSDKKTEELEQEIKELQNNMKEALLQIAKDLQIFPELPVGNDLVADVNQIYEEIEQVAKSEANPASEIGLQKEDWILKSLETATERLDEMEMWLVSQPDAVKRNTEAFDKQELPQIPVIPLTSEVRDIIGDLLEQEKKEEEKSDDSATNQGSADMPPGWAVAEGEFANYSAQGKSGNERPDHKEQDGRAIVGRQGMANGETTAGSGKINEGDQNIEKRMTQDSAQSGQVQEEGHAEAKATGGGKLGGYSDTLGMAGAGPRRDTQAAGNEAGWQALLRRNAEALFAKASLSHVRTGSLDEAARYMRDAEVAMQKGLPIREVREFQRKAVAALKQTQAELQSGLTAQQVQLGRSATRDAQLAAASDAAPPAYRDLVAEYFKALSEAPP
jgi:hypothetical protein